MRLHRGLHIRQGRLLLAAMVVMAMGLPMSAAPSVAAPGSPTDKVWVCKVVGPASHYRLQTGNNPIHVAINSTRYNAAFADSHPSFVVASDSFALCEAGFPSEGQVASVTEPTFTAGGCLGVGTVDAAETDAYSWSPPTGPISARVYTAVAQPGYTLALPTSWTYDLSKIPSQSTNPGGACYVPPVVPIDPTIQPKITLRAKVVNNDGGDAQVSDFTLTGSSIQVASAAAVQHSSAMVAPAVATSFSGVTGDATITNAVVPVGTYFLSESALPSGYSASPWACTGGQLNGSAVTVAFGNAVECVITNTYSSTVVDLPGVPTAHPASPPAAALGVVKAAPGAKTPTAVTPSAVTPSAAIPAAATLAFTGAEPVPLSLLALFALVLGVALTVAGRRQGSQGTRG